jgi:hypothetical protein
VVYRRDDEFCAWPHTSGFWETAEGHFVLGFKRDKVTYDTSGEVHHTSIATRRTYELVTVRSEDRGRTWSDDVVRLGGDKSYTEEWIRSLGPQDFSEHAPLDFTNKDILVASYSMPRYGLPTSKSWMRLSTDGGRSWHRPIMMQEVGLPALSAVNASIVRADGRHLIFLFTVSPDAMVRRPVVYASLDDGSNFTYLSHITPKLDDGATDGPWEGMENPAFAGHRWFYPKPVLLADGTILCALRCQRDPTSVMWTEIFQSDDGGLTWRFLSRVNDWGAPGALVAMGDGRIVCVYGYRLPPSGIRARVSEDKGRSWGPEIILRDDGGSWDVGYPNAVEATPGRILATYYINCRDDPVQRNGGVRHIAQTVFSPD